MNTRGYFRAYKNGRQYESKKYMTKKEVEQEEIFILKKDNPFNKPFDLVANLYLNELSKYRKNIQYIPIKKIIIAILSRFLKKGILTINVSSIREWAEKLEKINMSIKYKNKIRNVLNNIFDYAVKNYGLEINPSKMFGTLKKKMIK